MQTRLLSVVPQPILHMGWVIQPMWDDSYEVYPRTDASKYTSRTFWDITEAMSYIESEPNLEEA